MGLVFQAYRDPRGASVVALLFVMTGIAIVVYLNQTPLQPRERDYAYVGSFYAFAMWIGLGVMALIQVARTPGMVQQHGRALLFPLSAGLTFYFMETFFRWGRTCVVVQRALHDSSGRRADGAVHGDG